MATFAIWSKTIQIPLAGNASSILPKPCKILDMCPPNLHFKIYIYPTFQKLSLAYLSIGNKVHSHKYINGGDREEAPVALYDHKTKAIYLSLSDTTDGVLAHER